MLRAAPSVAQRSRLKAHLFTRERATLAASAECSLSTPCPAGLSVALRGSSSNISTRLDNSDEAGCDVSRLTTSRRTTTRHEVARGMQRST